MRERWRWLLYQGKRFRRWLARANGTPHQIALGVAVGFFVGWLPIIGIQMAVAVVICSLLRCNPLVPIGPIWLTNPVTFFPIFGVNYSLGRWIVGGPRWGEVMLQLYRALVPGDLAADLWSNPPLWAYSWVVEFFRNARHAARGVMALGAETMVPLWLGSVLVGGALATSSYYLTRWMVGRFRARLEARAARRAAAGGRVPSAP